MYLGRCPLGYDVVGGEYLRDENRIKHDWLRGKQLDLISITMSRNTSKFEGNGN